LTAAAKYADSSSRLGGGDVMAELTKRGSILCQRCGNVRRERVCPKCGWDACLIRISVSGKPIRIYDVRGQVLSYSSALVGLLIHEAVHVWQNVRDLISEDRPSREFEAYSIQSIAQKLIDAYKLK